MSKYTLIGPAEPLDPSHKRSKYSLHERPNNMLSKENAQKMSSFSFKNMSFPLPRAALNPL